jgi:hypothetical protein
MEIAKKVVLINTGKFGPEIGPDGPDVANIETITSGGISLCSCREANIDTKRLLPGISTRLVDRQSLQAGIASREAIRIIVEDINWERAGVILGSTFGATASMFDFYHNIVTEGVDYISPMEFPNTVSNAAASRVGIWLSLKGHCVSISNGNLSGLDAVGFAYKEIKKNLMDYYVAGGSEEISEVVKRIYSRIFEDRHQIDRSQGITHEVLYEGAGMLLLTSKEQAEENHIKPLCIIDGYASGTIKQDQNQVAVIDEIEKFIVQCNYSKDEVLLYTSLVPGSDLCYAVIDEAKQRFQADRVLIHNRFGSTVINYFAMEGIHGILSAIDAFSRPNGPHYRKTVVFNVENGGRFSAVAIQMPELF